MTMERREFLNLGALLAGGALLTSRVVFGRADERRPRFVLILMRGALDGLAAVQRYGDRDYAALRGEFGLRAPGEAGGALPLNGFFGLHPSLGFLQQCYAARELTVFHALASPYRERSHFDGQDVLENGSPRAHALQRSEEHTSELQSHLNLVCRLLLEKKKKNKPRTTRPDR